MHHDYCAGFIAPRHGVLSLQVSENQAVRHPLQGGQQPVGVPGGRGGRADEFLGELHEHGLRLHVGRAVQGQPAREDVHGRVRRLAVENRDVGVVDQHVLETLRPARHTGGKPWSGQVS